MPGETRHPLWTFFAALPLAAFGLNWVWEMVQMPVFAEMVGRPWQESVLTCTVASLGDTVITLAVYGIGALAARQIRWGIMGRWNVFATAAVLGGVSAAAFEWFSLATGRWSYNNRMPVVPVLNCGLWPLLQLTLLVPAAFWMARWWTNRR